MRIQGTTIPENKRLEIALIYLYGVGRSTAIEILKKAKISLDKKTKDLTPEESNKLRDSIEKYKIEADLRRERIGNIKRLQEIKTYRGIRHIKKLPVRGQNTKRNSRTVRGNVRKTMTSGKRKAEKK
ncbi:30S ribosomal protein S13 [Patescibacteria group bacterium]